MVRLRALHAFVIIAELKSFGKAAAHLNTTQPAISARIRGLEADLGRRLIHRNSRELRLTSEGQEVLRYAKPIVELTDRLSTLFSQDTQVTGTVRIGAIDTISASWLFRLFKRLRSEHPEVTFELRADTSANLIEDLRAGDVDIALAMGPAEEEGLVNVELGSFPMAWVANPQVYRFGSEMDVKQLADYPIISYPRGSRPYGMIKSFFGLERDANLQLNCSNSLATLVRLATEGFGIAAIPPAIIERELRTGLLERIPVRQEFPALDCHAIFYATSLSAAPGVIAELAREEAERFWAEKAEQPSNQPEPFG